jgi:hypothetical protein
MLPLFDGFDDIYQKRLSLKISIKNTIGGITNGINWFSLYSMFAIFLCQDNSTLRLSRTIKVTSEQPFGFFRCTCYFSTFCIPIAVGW